VKWGVRWTWGLLLALAVAVPWLLRSLQARSPRRLDRLPA